MRCAVKNCSNNNKKKPCNVNFFTFPLEASLQKQWIDFCSRTEDLKVKSSVICMDHFTPEDFENDLQYKMVFLTIKQLPLQKNIDFHAKTIIGTGFTKKRLLKKGAVPSVKKSAPPKKPLLEERSKRIDKRENKKLVDKPLLEHVPFPMANIKEEITVENEVLFEITEIRDETLLESKTSEVEVLKNELLRLQEENIELKRSLQTALDCLSRQKKQCSICKKSLEFSKS